MARSSLPSPLRSLTTGNPLTADDSDRKSTRLNSRHSQISYAVFCLKKNLTCISSPSPCHSNPHPRHRPVIFYQPVSSSAGPSPLLLWPTTPSLSRTYPLTLPRQSTP